MYKVILLIYTILETQINAIISISIFGLYFIYLISSIIKLVKTVI